MLPLSYFPTVVCEVVTRRLPQTPRPTRKGERLAGRYLKMGGVKNRPARRQRSQWTPLRFLPAYR